MRDWAEVRKLFEEAVSLAGDERERLLDAHQVEHAAAVAEVRAMLTADAAPWGVFETTASDLLERMRQDEDPERLCGLRVGAYRIDELLVSGGMAHVYRATRVVDGAERRVAFKVLRESLGDATFVDRFQAERRLLAGLEHENVVGFLDSDTLPDGRPFLVMDYVEGQALNEWAQGVPLERRLLLFEQVLETVQYAHAQLVVHRDLKPSNILVTRLGAPRLLDFGVATMLSRSPCQPGVPEPLTPVYASPEQLAGDPVTAVSDVFGLGVVLRELVTGSPVGTVRSADLRAILDKACAIDPGQRYPSVAAFLADLRRMRRREPVEARPWTAAYRVATFVRRNPWPLALVAAVLVSLTVGWVGAALDEHAARRDAAAGWGAHAEAKLTAHVLEDWMSTVTSADPTLAASAVAHLAQGIEELSPERPEVEVMLRLTLAQLLLDRGDREAARPHVERACELAGTTRGIGKRERERAASLRRDVGKAR